jgi:uncharacterized protein
MNRGLELMEPNFLEVALITLTALVMLTGSVIGALLPIPGAWVVWLAALGYGALRPVFGYTLFDGWIGGVAMVALTLLALVDLGLELVVTHTVAHRGGVSGKALLASIGLGLVGLLIFPPIGSLIGALLGLFLVEYQRHGRDARQAWRGVWSYAKGCGWSVVAEFGLCVVMMGIWGAWVALAFAFPQI